MEIHRNRDLRRRYKGEKELKRRTRKLERKKKDPPTKQSFRTAQREPFGSLLFCESRLLHSGTGKKEWKAPESALSKRNGDDSYAWPGKKGEMTTNKQGGRRKEYL